MPTYQGSKPLEVVPCAAEENRRLDGGELGILEQGSFLLTFRPQLIEILNLTSRPQS